MMRKLRKLADRTGWTVDHLIKEGTLEFVAKCQAKTNSITRRFLMTNILRHASLSIDVRKKSK